MIKRIELENWFNKNWYGTDKASRILLPLQWLYQGLSGLNKFVQQRRSFKASVPVIVVGNICVGGSGKTPLVIALVQYLLEKGYRPLVVSRGYGSQAPHYPWFVDPSQSSHEAGDEPLLIAQSCRVPVVIGAERKESIQAAMVRYPQVNIIVCDDGLQHYQMQRDIEIAVVDGQRGLGNARLLPVGPLREAPKRLREVDFVVSNGRLELPLATALPIRTMTLEPQALQPLSSLLRHEQQSSSGLSAPAEGDQVHLLTGIGNPERFKQTVTELGLEYQAHIYADHHQFQPEDLQFTDDKAIVMTAKDAIKCRDFAPENSWFLPVQASLPETFWQKLDSSLGKLKQQ